MTLQYKSAVTYQTDKISDTPFQYQTTPQYVIAEGTSRVAPSVDIKFPVETLTFDQLTQLLIEMEARHGMSTLEMFRRHIQEDAGDTQDLDEWFDLFFLYLGTKQIRHYTCP